MSYSYLENLSHFDTENSLDLQFMYEPSNKGLLAILFHIYFTVSKKKDSRFPLCLYLMLTPYTQNKAEMSLLPVALKVLCFETIKILLCFNFA